VVGIAHRLQRIAQRRTVGGSFSVGTVADMAIRMIAAVAGIGEPVHRSVRLHFVGRTTLFVVILAVFILDRRRITRAIGEGKSDAEDPRGDHDSHDQTSHGSCSLKARKESGTVSRSHPALSPGSRLPDLCQGTANTVSWPPRDV